MKMITLNKALRPAVYSICFGLFMLTSGCVLGFKVFRTVVRGKIAESVALKENTLQWSRFVEIPFPISFDVYMFNVTNPQEISQGKRPRVAEVGPYVYKQTRRKRIVDIGNDTVSYYQFWTHEFDANGSAPLTENDAITMLNVPLNSLMQVAEKDSPHSLTAINSAWRQVFNNEESIFHSVTVDEYLFGGYTFCRPSDLNAMGKIVCKEIGKRAAGSKSLQKQSDGSVRFALLAYKHNHHDGLYVINAGIDRVSDVGQIESWNNRSTTDYWSGNNNDCDRIAGTDASIYPPYSTAATVFTAYSSDVCRKVNLYHANGVRYEGVDGMRYEQRSDENADCYCTKLTRDLAGKAECLPNGFNDMFKCLDAPILLSLPHLLEADANYRGTVAGLLPEFERHITFVELEPDTGTPLRAAKRVQFNMILRRIRNMKVTQNLTASILPIMWIDEHFDLPIELVNELKENYLKKLMLLNIIKWTLICGGGLIATGSAAYLVRSVIMKEQSAFLK